MTISQAQAARFGKMAYELFEAELYKTIERSFEKKKREMKFCGCGDELRSSEDLKTNTCGICRSLDRMEERK